MNRIRCLSAVCQGMGYQSQIEHITTGVNIIFYFPFFVRFDPIFWAGFELFHPFKIRFLTDRRY